jgi:uncharacterized alpha-E superfamily protein
VSLGRLLERAAAEERISRQDWEMLLELATVTEEVLANGESNNLMHLVALVEGGVITVDGVPHTEILRRLSVFV